MGGLKRPLRRHGVPRAREVPNEYVDLIEDIRAEARELPYPLCDKPISQQVLDAMIDVPREDFLRACDRPYAYTNAPAPIGYGQTISQPFVVALMTDLLDLEDHYKVLEIGTGSGFQAAVLSKLAAEVYSVEIVAPLAQAAQLRLERLGYDNVHVREGDGCAGWPEHAPYDAVIVTAASPHAPPAVIDQMREGARLVIPIGAPNDVQWLTVMDKGTHGRITARRLLCVRFVPLNGAAGVAPL